MTLIDQARQNVFPCCGVSPHGYTGIRVRLCSERCGAFVQRLKPLGFVSVGVLDDTLVQQGRLWFVLVAVRGWAGTEQTTYYVEEWAKQALECVSTSRPLRALEYQTRRAAFLRACAADRDVLRAALVLRDMRESTRGGAMPGHYEDQIHELVAARGR